MKFLKKIDIILILIIISYIFYNELIKNDNTSKETNIYNLNYIEDNYIIEDNYNTYSDIKYQNIRRYRSDVDLDLKEDRVFIMFTGSLIIGFLLSFILLSKNKFSKKELITAKIILILSVIITGLIIFIN